MLITLIWGGINIRLREITWKKYVDFHFSLKIKPKPYYMILKYMKTHYEV